MKITEKQLKRLVCEAIEEYLCPSIKDVSACKNEIAPILDEFREKYDETVLYHALKAYMMALEGDLMDGDMGISQYGRVAEDA